MTNVFSYIKWRGDLSIDKSPFNDIDALILSRLSYLPFDDIIDKNAENKITLHTAAKRFFSDKNYMSKIVWKEDAVLLKVTATNPRFSDMKISGFVNIIENEKQMQFSAVVFEILSDCHFVSFRGTDTTLVGWQEDFNMYCMFPLPSQQMSVEYIEDVAGKVKGKLILGGHSKGGNLAIYSAAFCSGKTQERISEVYNFDGPGFEKKVIEQSNFKAIENRIRTFVPQSSVFGMLFEHQEEYTIVKSNQKGFLQHDIYSWEINRTSLVTLNQMTNTSMFFDHTISEFVSEMNIDERRDFTEAIFTLLKSTEGKTFNEIAEHWLKNSGTILKSIKNMDANERTMIISTLLNLIKCAKNNFSDINPLRKENRKSKNAP